MIDAVQEPGQAGAMNECVALFREWEEEFIASPYGSASEYAVKELVISILRVFGQGNCGKPPLPAAFVREVPL